MDDHNADLSNLKILLDSASAFSGWQQEQARDFVRVGEYSLALDGIAYAYLVNNARMPAEHYALFNQLALRMGLDGDPEYEGVAKLRAAQNAPE